MTMAKSAVAIRMQTTRVTAASRATKRSNRLSRVTDTPGTQRAALLPPPSYVMRRIRRSKVLLRLEDEGHRLLDVEALALFAHETRHGFDEGRLFRVDDLG